MLAENVLRNIHHIKLLLNKQLGIHRGGNVNTVVLCQIPYQFELINIVRSEDFETGEGINFRCYGTMKYGNRIFNYDLSEQDRKYAFDKIVDILKQRYTFNDNSQITLNNTTFKNCLSYSWPLPSRHEYEAKKLNLSDMIVRQVVPEIKKLHELCKKEIEEKDRQIKEFNDEFDLFYKWKDIDILPPVSFDQQELVAKMIASHKLYPSIKHVKEVWEI